MIFKSHRNTDEVDTNSKNKEQEKSIDNVENDSK